MKTKKRKSKKIRKARNKEFKGICDIINKALKRIILRKTKLTYQQELHLISKTLQHFIETAYIPRAKYKKDLLEQKFGWINHLEKVKNEYKKDSSESDIVEGLQIAISELKQRDKND